MSLEKIPSSDRKGEYYHHIDPGFINRRLCMSFLGPYRDEFTKRANPADGHFQQLANDHLLTTIVIDLCDAVNAPTLWEAIKVANPKHLFRSDLRLESCPNLYRAARVSHGVVLDFETDKPIKISYHTEHLTSSTGKMVLSEGYKGGYIQSVVGLVHDKGDHFDIEPLIIGNPWLDHPRNEDDSGKLMWIGREHGELLAQDIDQFSRLVDVNVASSDEWMSIMKSVPEETVKKNFAALLAEPTKKDWGGESNDHYSANLSIDGRTKTAAFMFKGPTNFREMTMEMCGKRADQLNRLINSGAEISVVQHSHLIGETVRHNLKALTVFPGKARKCCAIDGQTTYRIFKAYSLL